MTRSRRTVWRFNTQPPEGGWGRSRRSDPPYYGFNTQPPEGGCTSSAKTTKTKKSFQHTAARRRLRCSRRPNPPYHGFNTQPPEGGWGENVVGIQRTSVSTHSRPKAAGRDTDHTSGFSLVSTHSRPKAAVTDSTRFQTVSSKFQHTAARRRLIMNESSPLAIKGFNTQPPEGGCMFVFCLFGQL